MSTVNHLPMDVPTGTKWTIFEGYMDAMFIELGPDGFASREDPKRAIWTVYNSQIKMLLKGLQDQRIRVTVETVAKEEETREGLWSRTRRLWKRFRTKESPSGICINTPLSLSRSSVPAGSKETNRRTA